MMEPSDLLILYKIKFLTNQFTVYFNVSYTQFFNKSIFFFFLSNQQYLGFRPSTQRHVMKSACGF